MLPNRPTRSQNAANSSPRSGGSSVFKGVSWHKGAVKWTATSIASSGKQKYLGLFTDEIEAALAYDEYAYHTWGEFAYLNREHFDLLADAKAAP